MTYQDESDGYFEYLEDKTPQTSVAKLISLSINKHFYNVRDDEDKYLPYFNLIKAFALMGENEKKFLIECGMIRKIVELYTGDLNIKGYSITVRSSTLISLLSLLVRSCTTDFYNGCSEPHPPFALPNLTEIKPLDRKAMFTGLTDYTPRSFFPLLIADVNGGNDDEILEIVCFWGFGNWEISQTFLSEAYSCIINNVKRSERKYMLQFRIMRELLQMDDEFHEKRLHEWFPKIGNLIEIALGKKKIEHRMIYIILTSLINMGLTNPLLKHCDEDTTSLRKQYLNLLSPLKKLAPKKSKKK